MAVRLKDRIEANIRQSDKVNSDLKIYLQGSNTTYLYTYNGSKARSIYIYPDVIGALAKTGGTMTGILELAGTGPFQAIRRSLEIQRKTTHETYKEGYTWTSTNAEDSTKVDTNVLGENNDGFHIYTYYTPPYGYVKTLADGSTENWTSYGVAALRMQSIEYGTGNFSNYYSEYRLPTNRIGLTSNIINYFNTSDENVGGANKPVYVSAHGRLVAGNTFVPTSGGTFSGSVYFSSTIMKYGDSGYYTYIDYYRRGCAGEAGVTDGYTWASGNTGAWIAWAGYAIGGVETNGTETKSYSTYWATRAWSINSTTGAKLSYYYTFRLPAVPDDLTSSSSYYIASSYYSGRGGANQPVYLSGGYLQTCNSFVPTSGGSFTGQVTATSFNVEANARFYTAMYSTRKAQTVEEATYTSNTKTYTPVGDFARSTIGYFGMCAPFSYTYVDSSDNSTGTYSSGAYPVARIYSMDSATGNKLSTYWTIRTVAVDNNLTANTTMYIPVSSSAARGAASRGMYMSDGKLYDGNYFVPTTGGTFTGDLNFTRSTTIANNTPIKLNFTVTQTDNNVSNKAIIAVYDDLDTTGNGVNMVINATSGLYLTAGEGARDYLATYPSTAEQVHICADSTIYFHTNCNTTTSATSSVYINTSGVLYGACWNDYAEYRKTTYTKPGRVVVEKGDGSLCQSWDRLLPGCEIVSDTYGFVIGETEECKTPIAVSGRVLAYPYEDRESYQPGDAVCSAPGGCVSRMTRQEITMYPERIIGTVSEIPEYNTWGEKDIEVDGRIWIRIR